MSLLGIAVDDLLVNRSGGAIILGHPLVMRDTRIIGTTALELVAIGGKRALCVMCRDVDKVSASFLSMRDSFRVLQKRRVRRSSRYQTQRANVRWEAILPNDLRFGRVPTMLLPVLVGTQAVTLGLIKAANGEAIYRGVATDEPVGDMIEHEAEGLRRSNRPPFLPSAVFCGFRALRVLSASFPPDLARGIRPFVDLLLTRRGERKKPPGRTARNVLICNANFGCGGRMH